MEKNNFKYPPEVKKDILELHLLGFTSSEISKVYGLSRSQICLLTRRYNANGYECLEIHSNTIRYPKDFKEMVVRDIIENMLPYDKAAIKHGISPSSARKWFYNKEKSILNRSKAPRNSKHEQLISYAMPSKKKRIKPMQDPAEREKELELELEHARMEIEYLKKLGALVREREKRESLKSPKPSKN